MFVCARVLYDRMALVISACSSYSISLAEVLFWDRAAPRCVHWPHATIKYQTKQQRYYLTLHWQRGLRVPCRCRRKTHIAITIKIQPHIAVAIKIGEECHIMLMHIWDSWRICRLI